MKIKIKKSVEGDRNMKAWDIDDGDVVRFVLRRDEWHTLIEALAHASARRNPFDKDDAAWRGLDVLRTAQVDIDASKMTKALRQIAEWTKGKADNPETLIHTVATTALKTDEEEKKAA